MKKSLLFLASVLMSAGSFAQTFTATWEKPTVTNFVDMADDGETTQFLYNVGAKGFLVGHNEWSTRASVAEYGDSIRMKALEDGTWNIGCYPAVYTNKNKWLYVSAEGEDSWVDGDAQRTGIADWVLVKNSNGSYQITNNVISVIPGTYGVAEIFKGETGNTRIYFKDEEAEYTYDVEGESQTAGLTFQGAFWDEWQFVSVAEYEAYKEKVPVYLAAVDLKAKIEGAMEKGITADALADEFEVYNNTESSLEDLKKAADSAYDKGRWVEIAPFFENIVDGEKNDVSGVFTNPDFEAGNVNGWDITWKANTEGAKNIGYQHRDGGYNNGDVSIVNFIEAWKDNTAPNYLSDGSITQTVPGLPAGKYTLAVDVIANAQWRNNARPDNVQLFAKASLDGKEYYDFVATDNEKPEHFEFTFVHTGGSMTLGLRVINADKAQLPVNWIAMDNLQLFYYGALTDDPDKVMLDQLIDQVLAAHPVEELEDVKATVSIKEAFEQTLASAQAATEDYEAWQDKVKQAQEDLEEAISAYVNFEAKSQEWYNNVDVNGSMFEDYDTPEWGDFADFVQNYEVEGYPTPSIEEVLEKNELTPAQLEKYIAVVDSLYGVAFGKSLRPGMDCSSLLVNASFADGFTGWTHAGGTFGGLKADPCVEVYENKVDVYQIVKNVPDGVYTLECQAFERPSGNGSYDGTEESKVFLYMNDYQTGVQNIMADAMPEDQAVDKENCFTSGGEPDEEFYNTGGTTNADYLAAEGYVPNGMSGASYAFRAGRYVQKVYGLVEGGTMKIGLTSNNVTAHWVLWSKFKLIYEGAGEDATAIMLEQNIATLKKYVEENADENMTVVAAEAANKVISDAEETSKNGTAEEMTEAITTVRNALEAAKANVAAMAQFIIANDMLESALDDDPSDAGLNAYEEIQGDVEGDYMNMDTEELLALVEKMEEVVALLRLPDYATASDGNPVDFTKVIVNNSFEDGLNGWAYYETSETKSAENSNDTYRIDIADGSYVFNTWANPAPEGGFYVSQVLKSLPAGTYELQAVLASDKGNKINLTANGKGDLFEMVGAKENGQEASIIFKLEEEGSVEIKAQSENWFKADNFRLTYFGAESEQLPTEIEGIETAAPAKANGKYLENGRIVIMKNGVKYNVAGQRIK